jgi:hypothetical protein
MNCTRDLQQRSLSWLLASHSFCTIMRERGTERRKEIESIDDVQGSIIHKITQKGTIMKRNIWQRIWLFDFR